MRKSLIIASLLVGSCLSASASELGFTFNVDGAEPDYYGTNLKDTYDVAILISNPTYAGAKLMSVEVPVPGASDNYSDCSVWLSSALQLKDKVNAPDILSVSAVVENGVLKAVLPEPYVMTEAPLYVGYSFAVSQLTEESKEPVAIVEGSNSNGLYLHTKRKLTKWRNYVANFSGGAQSAMTVHLSGDFADNALALNVGPTLYAKSGDETEVSFSVVNDGIREVTDFDYSWTADGVTTSGKVDFSSENPLNPLGIRDVSITVPAISKAGMYDAVLTILKVNGSVNADVAGTGKVAYRVADVLPVYRPLVEEYTGMWCGACPIGYVQLETLYDLHPDTFVAMAWHGADVLQIDNEWLRANVNSFPNARINRGALFHPAYLDTEWKQAMLGISPISVEVSISKEADGKTLKADAKVMSLNDLNNVDYALSYYLVADGLENPDWEQSNYYAGENDPAFVGNPYYEIFNQGGEKIKDLEYNDVVVKAPDFYGVDGSLPANFVADEVYSHSYSFDISSFPNYMNEEIPVNIEKVRCIAVVVDTATGQVLNSCSSTYLDGTSRPVGIVSVETIDAEEAQVSGSEYYTIDGRRLQTPSGICIRVDRLTDNSRKATKILVR